MKLFSASSVREATRSTLQNRYILVFTVATVIYLPLSFVTVSKESAHASLTG
jgi:hypothetical protein